MQSRLYRAPSGESRREAGCQVCHGNRLVCIQNPSLCPVYQRAKGLVEIERAVNKTVFNGPSPPGVFLGSADYPFLRAGPPVPILPSIDGIGDAAILDDPSRWLDTSIDDLVTYRFSLVRGKTRVKVADARNPDRTLSLVQELALARTPTETELHLTKKPQARIYILPRSAPHGPSGSIEKMMLTENTHVPRPVEKVTSDRDIGTQEGIFSLYERGVSQQQITRVFSVGQLGVFKNRRLVPTEWSITAVDDILGKSILDRVRDFPQLGDFRVYGAEALGNNVQVLLLPTAWMYEALEGWLTASTPQVYSDHEFHIGRRDYPSNIAGAYHAVKLPILEFLEREHRQAGAIAFLEVDRDWVPLGVWRFRELARRALSGQPIVSSSLEASLSEVGQRLSIPLRSWIVSSKLVNHYKRQLPLDQFTMSRKGA
ncbi:hypothetical protein E6H16_04075 [Candidatus Bathyarchaeota archaeon]|nr:MAG: hypothetical protein E6H16_04075 [Candidatus Bathyarchaeota archaeon]